jgi:hypothetical protein
VSSTTSDETLAGEKNGCPPVGKTRMYLVPLINKKMTGKIDDPNIQTPYTGVTGIEHSAQTRISISYYRYYYGRW